MTPLAQQVVHEWLNRVGFHEMDLRAQRPKSKDLECSHPRSFQSLKAVPQPVAFGLEL